MNVDDYKMSRVFLGGGNVQYVLPIFQREYAWEQDEWQILFDDIVESYNEGKNSEHEHFLGSLVVIEEDSEVPLFHSYTLVDGQQRLTTISLILCALRDCLDETVDLRETIQDCLLNSKVKGELRYKILPTTKYDDRRTYCAIIDESSTNVLRSRSRIIDAYEFYLTRISDSLARNEFDANTLFESILSSLYIVFIELDRTDKPYKIFESLNAKGKPLTEADLVRNYIAMRLPPKRQQQIFDSEWSKIEDKLSERRETANIPELTAFLRHYLAMNNGHLARRDEVYIGFRKRTENTNDSEFILEIQKLRCFASHYNKLLRPENETAGNVKAHLKRLNILQATTAYPLLIYYYDLFASDEIEESEFVKVLQVVENYLVRRFLAGEPTNYHNSMFTTLANDLQKSFEKSAKSLEAALGERNYPSDNRLRQRLMWNRLYSSNKSRRIVFVFETLNKLFDSDIKLDGQGTVEHIMPRRISDEWKKHLGDDWQEVHREHLDTIGNLTIVTQMWNTQQLSNKPFSTKRKSLQKHGIHLNSTYFTDQVKSWNADALRERTNYLADRIVEVWPAITEPPRPLGVTGKKPLTLTVRDSLFPVYSWKSMVMTMVNQLHKIQLLRDRSRAQLELGWRIVDDPEENGGAYKYEQSSKGWWIHQWLSAEEAVEFCRLLANYCGLNDDEWSFTYE